MHHMPIGQVCAGASAASAGCPAQGWSTDDGPEEGPGFRSARPARLAPVAACKEQPGAFGPVGHIADIQKRGGQQGWWAVRGLQYNLPFESAAQSHRV